VRTQNDFKGNVLQFLASMTSHLSNPHSTGCSLYSFVLSKFPVIFLSGPILITKQTRCTNFLNLFLELNSTCFGQFLCPSSGVFHCTHSNGICHTVLLTACEQDQDGTAISVLILLASCQQTCTYCCVYSEKLLMMDRGTVRNM
jgi:hypothetical protein